MNKEAQEALSKYRELKIGMAAINALMLEIECLAWDNFIESINDSEQEEPPSSRCF